MVSPYLNMVSFSPARQLVQLLVQHLVQPVYLV